MTKSKGITISVVRKLIGTRYYLFFMSFWFQPLDWNDTVLDLEPCVN